MAETFISDRVKFSTKGVQSKFILLSKETLGLKWFAFAKKLKINTRTLYSWTREKSRISLVSLQTMSQLAKLPIPKNYTVIKWNSHLKNICKDGGRAVIVKYGRVAFDEEHRKEKWRQWWKAVGQHKESPKGFQSLLKIKIPKKDEKLAEFVGIMLGDGGVNKYHTSITLSSQEQPYILFVSKMISKLFGVIPKIYRLKYAEAVDIIVNRKQLVDFCQDIGLVQGNKIKHQVDIPEWIKKDEMLTRDCIRGLVDTDGCFYTNSYFVNGKKYSYFKIAFTSASLPLINSVAESLRKLGINARISKNQKDVRIESNQYVLKYINEIGSHNSKHLQKIKEWKNKNNVLK